MRYSATPMLLLGLFALTPFVVLTIITLTDIHIMGYSGQALFASYSAILLSFVNGVLSGQVLEGKPQKYSNRTMVLNHLIMLVAWGSLFMKVPELSIGILLLGFITAFWLDGRWLRLVSQSYKAYSKIRFALTVVLSVMHVIVLFPVY